MKNEVIITVSGKAMSGKSRLTYTLKKFLREQGFEVEFCGNADHPTEADFDKRIGKNIDEVLSSFKETRKIIIKEVQLPLNESVL